MNVFKISDEQMIEALDILDELRNRPGGSSATQYKKMHNKQIIIRWARDNDELAKHLAETYNFSNFAEFLLGFGQLLYDTGLDNSITEFHAKLRNYMELLREQT